MKLGELQDRIFTALGDPDGSVYGVDTNLMTSAIDAAHEAVLPRFAKASSHSETGDGTTTVFTLPDDLYEIWAVYDAEEGYFLPKAALTPLSQWGADYLSGNAWIPYPHKSLTFSDAPDGSFTIHYGAYWPVPEVTDTVLEVPDFLLTPIVLYAAHICLNPELVKSTSDRDHNLRTDSGTPIQNPFKETSQYLYTLFLQALARVPANEVMHK